MAFNFCQAIGYYGFANRVPTLLIGQGITVTKACWADSTGCRNTPEIEGG
ncbi:hypothetical protein [Paraburkholderia sp. BL6665CI2N2]|nr:hypothetical protein [Paraburkholderia sp. BL6665CI2N2]